MKRKQRTNKQAAPGESRGSLQQQKKKHAVGGMEQDVDFVMSSGVQAEELAVERVREPRQRMIVGGVQGRERPLDGRPGKAATNVRVAGEVGVVVVVEKSVVSYRDVTGEYSRCKQK